MAVLLMIILKIHIKNIFTLKPESDSPIRPNGDTASSLAAPFEFMQMVRMDIHGLKVPGGVQTRQY